MGTGTDLFDDAAAQLLGLNRTDLRVLDVIDRMGPIAPSRLADESRISRPAMTTALDRLEKAGYAKRTPDSGDRRRVLVEMTPLARERTWEIYGPFSDLTDKVFGRYSVEELEVVLRFMRQALEMNAEQLERIAPPLPD
jgi:DNA-binding MarR family transcriptional regulator